jgi:hypothetical protein
MNGSQPAEKFLTACGDPGMNLAAVGGTGLSPDEAAVAQPIDQFDGCVVSKLHSFRQHANRGRNFGSQTLYGEQQLMLLAVQAILPGSLFTECEKFSDLIAEFCERAVILRIHVE